VIEGYFWIFVVLLYVLLVAINWYRRRPVEDLPLGTPYKIYTTEYDIEIRAEDIARRVADISPHCVEYWQSADNPKWIAAVEEADRAAELILESDSVKALPENLTEFAISILVDHSGSLKGDSIKAVASTLKALTKALTSRGAKVELLGFTTAGWQGGLARQKWLSQGRPRYPGRLCALMHIIYKSADDDHLRDEAFHVMLNAGVLYENIDGEALEWAERRLLSLPAKNKLLIVVSDGAPVDDSTLLANGPSILWRHIKQVISRIESENLITLGGLGINYRVSGFYVDSVFVENDLASQLPETAFSFLGKLIRHQQE
jgi:cobaltochelatase CobT